MAEFEVGGQRYRSRRMDLFTQLHLIRRLGPVLAHLAPAIAAGETVTDTNSLGLILEAIGKMPEEDFDFVLKSCLSVVSREQPGGIGWASVMSGGPSGVMMFEDIGMREAGEIFMNVMGESIGPFSAAGRLNGNPA